MSENIRITISLSRYEYILLKRWATLHAKPPATFASQIIGNRVESNSELIDREYEKLGLIENKTVAEMDMELFGDGV